MPKSSKARKSWFTGKRKKIATIGAVVVLLIIAALAGLLMRSVQNQATDVNGNNPNQANNDRDLLPPSVVEAQDLIATGKSEEAGKQLSENIASSSNNDEKFELYLTQGVNYENQKQYDNAINAYKSAEGIKKDSTVYAALGRVAAAKGDKAGAIAYYKQAIESLSKDDPRYNAEKNELEQTIKGLGG